MLKNLSARVKKMPPAIWMILITVLYFGFTTNNYYNTKNLTNVIIHAAPLFIAACGQTMVILTEGTDMSIGATMNMVMVFWMILMKNGVPMPVAMAISLAAAVFVGLLNGVIVTKLRLPPFIATLGMMNILNSIALSASNGSTVTHRHEIYKIISRDTFLGIPYILWIAIACFLLSWVLLNKMRFGARVRALGGNREALEVSGYSVHKAEIQVYIFAGLMAGIAGLVLACRIESGHPSGADGFEFNTIAAALLGGTSMIEGRGSIIGTVFGVLLIQILRYSLVLQKISSIYQTAIIGIVVLIAVIVDASAKRKQEQ